MEHMTFVTSSSCVTLQTAKIFTAIEYIIQLQVRLSAVFNQSKMHYFLNLYSPFILHGAVPNYGPRGKAHPHTTPDESDVNNLEKNMRTLFPETSL